MADINKLIENLDKIDEGIDRMAGVIDKKDAELLKAKSLIKEVLTSYHDLSGNWSWKKWALKAQQFLGEVND